jgi:GNAT superfamily N-acetyltransferase
MSKDDLMLELNAGVNFWGWEESGRLVGVLGVQHVMDAVLVRHAYVRPAVQRNGLGSVLLNKIISMSTGILLVGTWADAYWAIRFYERHGFMRVSTIEKDHLLTKYWHIPQQQKLASVVLKHQ